MAEKIQMTNAQKELLLKVTQLHLRYFDLQMQDHWSSDDYIRSSNMREELNSLEAQYQYIYGALPEWKYIDDIVKTRNELREELAKNNKGE